MYYITRQKDRNCCNEQQMISMLRYNGYGVFTTQLVRYARACRNYADFLYRVRTLTVRLLGQGHVATSLKSSLQKFYGRHHELLDRYGVSI